MFTPENGNKEEELKVWRKMIITKMKNIHPTIECESIERPCHCCWSYYSTNNNVYQIIR